MQSFSGILPVRGVSYNSNKRIKTFIEVQYAGRTLHADPQGPATPANCWPRVYMSIIYANILDLSSTVISPIVASGGLDKRLGGGYIRFREPSVALTNVIYNSAVVDPLSLTVSRQSQTFDCRDTRVSTVDREVSIATTALIYKRNLPSKLGALLLGGASNRDITVCHCCAPVRVHMLQKLVHTDRRTDRSRNITSAAKMIVRQEVRQYPGLFICHVLYMYYYHIRGPSLIITRGWLLLNGRLRFQILSNRGIFRVHRIH